MKVEKFSIADASMERSPGQDGDVFAGNLIDERHGGPVTVGYGRYGPDQCLSEQMAVHDVMVVLEGELSISTEAGELAARSGEIVYMPRGETVTIRSHAAGAVTAYVTYPHWRQPEA
jgi:ethanolamine utilization protein EutQ (cupin superfamily)